jgi:hypothetical protein
MPTTLLDNQSTTFSTAVSFKDSTRRAEFWGVDDATTPASEEDIWVQIGDPAGVLASKKIAAGQTFYIEFTVGYADNWTWSVKANAGTADIFVMET